MTVIRCTTRYYDERPRLPLCWNISQQTMKSTHTRTHVHRHTHTVIFFKWNLYSYFTCPFKERNKNKREVLHTSLIIPTFTRQKQENDQKWVFTVKSRPARAAQCDPATNYDNNNNEANVHLLM